jgi:flavin reductase (DIM6/NTAB) family NADH-FMN oxidoreductase RutF
VDLNFAELTTLERYKLLTGLVFPRPIAWVSTWGEDGVANCAPYSFFNVFSSDPALLILGFGLHPNGALKDSLSNIRRTSEFVVNLVDESTANAMHISSQHFPPHISEFEMSGLTARPASVVRHPRIAEAPACFECKVFQRLEINAGRELVIGEILLVHAREGLIDPQSKRVSEEMYQPIGRLYGDRYCTYSPAFQLAGPLPDQGSAS